jgi:hypothetical protein
MLEQAGGLISVTPEGESTQGAPLEPDCEVEDDVEYLRPATRTLNCWKTTGAGAALLASYDPKSDIARLLGGDEAYLDIYLRVLDLCADEGGATTPQLSAAVDKDPLVQSPRLFAQHFTERLEKAGAVKWDGRWKITQAGQDWLARAAR